MSDRPYPHPPLVAEVDGPLACFTRPELKTERVSYPVMTPSAARGVLEAIYWKPEFDYVITAIEVLAPIRWASIRRNEVSSVVTLDWIRRAMADPAQRFDAAADRDQRNTVFLRDVAYRINAQVRPRPHAGFPEAAYRDQFRRRVDRGACFSQPFLGTRECSATFGKAAGRAPIPYTDDLGVMLHSIGYNDSGETYRWFHARLESGVLTVPEHGIELTTAGLAEREGNLMLLTRLAEHAAHRRDLPPAYYRTRAVRWVLSITGDGTPAAPELQDQAGSDQPRGQVMWAPCVYRSGQRPPAVLLVDTLQYVLARPAADSERDRAETERRNRDYVALLGRWHDSAPGDEVARAVLAFFGAGHHLSVTVSEDAKPADLVAVMVAGEWAHLRESAISFWASVVRERKSSAAGTGICLACGQQAPLLDTIPEAVKSGAIPAGSGRGRDAQLVSVNKPAQGRGGKIQLASAPVCDRCGSAAMSTLNVLLADETHRHRSTDSVLVWWLREPADLDPLAWLNQPEPQQVKKLIEELDRPHREPAPGGVDANAFYAVTMSVNQSRVVVRDWLEAPIEQLQASIGRWFADHQMTDLWRDGPQVVPLWLLARSAGRWGTENGRQRYLSPAAPVGCERDLLLAALRGTRPPGYLLPRLLQRIRGDGHIDLARAALLRLILTRTPHVPKETCMPGLNPDAPYPAYQCGRMFAVLEQIQRAALGEVNTTIADKFLPAATTTPRAILVMLNKNASGHLRRLRRRNPGAYRALNIRLDEVLGRLGADSNIPAVLDTAGQAQFILGYHHQRAADMAAARAHSQQQLTATS